MFRNTELQNQKNRIITDDELNVDPSLGEAAVTGEAFVGYRQGVSPPAISAECRPIQHRKQYWYITTESEILLVINENNVFGSTEHNTQML